MTIKILLLLGFLAGSGIAFYGGMLYQKHENGLEQLQKLLHWLLWLVS